MDKISIQIKTSSLEIGADIKRARERRGMSQYELADLAGIKLATLRKLEAKRTIPRLTTLDRILGVLEMELRIAKKGGAGVHE